MASAAPTASVERVDMLANHLASCRYNLPLPEPRSSNGFSFRDCMKRWIRFKADTYAILCLDEFKDMHPLLPHWTSWGMIAQWLRSESLTMASLEKSVPGNCSAARCFLSSSAPRPSLIAVCFSSLSSCRSVVMLSEHVCPSPLAAGQSPTSGRPSLCTCHRSHCVARFSLFAAHSYRRC